MTSSAKLHVGIFVSSLGLIRGGLETIGRNFAAGLVERGHRVTVVSGYWPGHQRPLDLVSLPVRWLRTPCVPASLRSWGPLARRRPGWPLKVQSLSFAYACRLHPQVRELIATADVTLTFFEIEAVKFSAWRHQQGQPSVYYFSGLIDWSWLQKDQSAVRVAISRTIAKRCQDLPDFRVDGVITPGIPHDWLEVPYQIRPKARTLIFVGRLEANKGVMELLTIFEALASEFPDLQLRILGEGPLRPVVETKLIQMGLSSRSTCLGAAPSGRVRQELRNADLFIFPTHYESFGIAVLEAQAVGVPVVASDIPAIREVSGETGRLVPVEDVELWIETIRLLIRDRAARERMSVAGRERAEQFTWRQAAEDMERYLYLAMSRGAPPHPAAGA